MVRPGLEPRTSHTIDIMYYVVVDDDDDHHDDDHDEYVNVSFESVLKVHLSRFQGNFI